MRWFIALMLALVMVTPAFAGEDPYIATVTYLGGAGTRLSDTTANKWYISPKHAQFLLDEAPFLGGGTTNALKDDAMCWPISGTTPQCEAFNGGLVNQPEVCWYSPTAVWNPSDPPDPGLRNGVVAHTAGSFEWWVRLPKTPTGEINLVLECGVLKPNAFGLYGYKSIEVCAAETGERVADGCTNNSVNPGTNPLIIGSLPKITAIAFPGKWNFQFKPFNLTAFKNPGAYNPFSGVNLDNNASAVLLDAIKFPNLTRIVLKSCMDKTIITKLPVTGQVNALGDVEHDLNYGDLIYVRLDIPRSNPVDIYCNQQSLKVVGIGESWF
jgi:hypothetical protein